MSVSINLMEGIHSQCMYLSNNDFVLFRYITILLITPQKSWKKISLPCKEAADECKGSGTPRQLRVAAPRKYQKNKGNSFAIFVSPFPIFLRVPNVFH